MSDQPVRRAEQRASDADRDVVAGDLRNAFDVGRLDADEYQLRLDAVWRSRTYGDLDKLTADLPEPLQRMHAQAAQGRKAIEEVKGRELAQRLGQWKAWLGVAVLMIAIWTIGSITSGELHHFWPLWPICIWGRCASCGCSRRQGSLTQVVHSATPPRHHEDFSCRNTSVDVVRHPKPC